MSSEIQWLERFNDYQITQIHKLMLGEWWCSDRTLKEVTDLIKNTDISLAAANDAGEILAYCRILTDYQFKAVIFDVIVSSNERSSGLGKKLVQAALAHKKLNRVRSFELYCPDQISEFYVKLGFMVSESKLHCLRVERD